MWLSGRVFGPVDIEQQDDLQASCPSRVPDPGDAVATGPRHNHVRRVARETIDRVVVRLLPFLDHVSGTKK